MKASDMKIEVVSAEPAAPGWGVGDSTEYTVAVNGCEMFGPIVVGDSKVSIFHSVCALFVEDGAEAEATLVGATDIEDMRARLAALHAAGQTRLPVEIEVKRDEEGQLIEVIIGPAGFIAAVESTAGFNRAEWQMVVALLREEGLLDQEDQPLSAAIAGGGATVELSRAQLKNLRAAWRDGHPDGDDPSLSEALAAVLPHRPVRGGLGARPRENQ